MDTILSFPSNAGPVGRALMRIFGLRTPTRDSAIIYLKAFPGGVTSLLRSR